MATATLNISLPETMKAEVEQIIASEGYGNTSEFFRELVRNYIKQRQEHELEAVLVQRLKSNSSRTFNIEDVRKELAIRLSKEKKRRA